VCGDTFGTLPGELRERRVSRARKLAQHSAAPAPARARSACTAARRRGVAMRRRQRCRQRRSTLAERESVLCQAGGRRTHAHEHAYTAAGMSALSIWMNDTDRKVYAALPNQSVNANSAPGGGKGASRARGQRAAASPAMKAGAQAAAARRVARRRRAHRWAGRWT
jgi:hypothetical protein